MAQLRIVVGLITRENDYQQEQAAVAEATAKRLGITLQVLFAGNDAIAQTKQLLAVIHAPEAERPHAVIVEPVGTGMPGVAGAAEGKGVGWIVLNREAEYLRPLRASKVPIGSVDCDNPEVGRIQGRQFAALLPGGGRMIYIEGPAADVSKLRRMGMQETVPKNIEIKALRGKWTEESGYQAMSARLQRQATAPEVDLVGCQNDAMAKGARRAVEELPAGPLREQWLKVPFTGVDGVPGTGKQWVDKGVLAATVVTPPLTGIAIEMLFKALSDGTQVPERTLRAPACYPPLEQLRARPAPTVGR